LIENGFDRHVNAISQCRGEPTHQFTNTRPAHNQR
jgi:hypothetical protein